MMVDIDKEQTIRVLLQAGLIPDGSAVMRKTGEMIYVLRHGLNMYPEDALKKKGAETLKVRGCFILGERGNITQVEPATELLWVVEAQDFVDALQGRWEEQDSQ